jgi:DNA cross-link repair 1C protein
VKSSGSNQCLQAFKLLHRLCLKPTSTPSPQYLAMSTFNGIVSEFPRIRIDFFRVHASQPPPLACFLSHIHSDHLQGLESLKAPFVYCSAATRRLLLRLEKYPHRMNFLKGVLESRKQHYRHLKLVLKAIPLECPTQIELGPLEKIRVTLFDANHCPGAVLFLIEGDGKAILYTGDIRSEPWWVNSLVRNPVLLPYTGGLKKLDGMYLDTTFAVKEDLYQSFPSKAEGVRELLAKIHQYPPETLFYLNAWTLGYEDVWVALSSFLRSRVGTHYPFPGLHQAHFLQVHIDSYQSRLYGSLSCIDDVISVGEYSALNGFYVGNHHKPGCLTTQSTTRIHSCEPGTPCHTQLLKAKHVVWINPVITRSAEGIVVPEHGAGGGGGDLHQTPELELRDMRSTSEIVDLCKQFVREPLDVQRLLAQIEVVRSSRDLRIPIKGVDLDTEGDITLQEFAQRLLALDTAVQSTHEDFLPQGPVLHGGPATDTIHFPFSRHSSYNELCDLVAAFKPGDIYPCTVDEQTWTEDVSMKALFGHLCSGLVFRHDEEMRSLLRGRQENEGPSERGRKRKHAEDSQESGSLESTSQEYTTAVGSSAEVGDLATNEELQRPEDIRVVDEEMPQYLAAIKAAYEAHEGRAAVEDSPSSLSDEAVEDTVECESASASKVGHMADSQVSVSQSALDSQPEDVQLNLGLQLDGVQDERPSIAATRVLPSTSNDLSNPRRRRSYREQAYRAAKRSLQSSDSGAWDDLGIRSVGSNGHCEREEEL